MADFGTCDLHIPHKDWARDIPGMGEGAIARERENYSEIERWAKRFHDNCVGEGCTCGSVLAFVTEQETFSSGSLDFSGPIGMGGIVITSPFSGGTAMSWDAGTAQVVIHENGIYAVQCFVNFAYGTPGVTFGYLGASVFRAGMGFAPTYDDDYCGILYPNHTPANTPGGSSKLIRVNPKLTGAPMPAASRLSFSYIASTNTQIQVDASISVTKVNCCPDGMYVPDSQC